MSAAFASISKHLKRHFLLWIVVIFLVLVVGGYAAGFRPGPGLTFVRVGTLTVINVPVGSTVYADQAPRGTIKSGSSLSVDLVPGNHTIIVDAPLQEPWEKIVSIVSNESTAISPILIPKQPNPQKLSGTDANTAVASFSSTKLPSETAPLHMNCADVFVSNNRVIAKPATTLECTPPEYLCTDGSCEPTIVYAPAALLRSVIPFPGRTDAVIVATGEWVYALALDPRNPQYFAPIIHGTAPIVAPASTSSFYTLDAGHTYSLFF